MLDLFRGRNSVVKRNRWVLANMNCILSGKFVGSLNESQDDSVDSGKGVLSEYPYVVRNLKIVLLWLSRPLGLSALVQLM